ncbi:hypothetical protein SARC_08817 [Sphaeroforma arctica JP610]|uniref:Uncharacterized protein n=1 Tax=Sphaeroforma arctica JP610 TaxID=667725 RepID=A0A0L0FPN2_9EUKA|nr:hypothetical protein SARC_08817 [Sphaeroforma arctica JP610]KNC78762.1 hypothetical protein SARC_08817 [Sphaeroforma arctica JP610]|eukprot:XP_014152664.1 hypothetical protein SARC_08817 [Sphaeroforma arctica JP610]
MEHQVYQEPDFSNAGAPLRRASSGGVVLQWKPLPAIENTPYGEKVFNVQRDRCEESIGDTGLQIERCCLQIEGAQFLVCLKMFYYPVTIELTLEYAMEGICFTKSNVILKLFHRNDTICPSESSSTNSNIATDQDDSGSGNSGRSTYQATDPLPLHGDTMMFESPDDLDAVVSICKLDNGTREEVLRFLLDCSIGVDTVQSAQVQGCTLKQVVQSSTRMPELAKVLCKAWS